MPVTYELKTKTATSAEQTFSDIILLPDTHPVSNFAVHFDFKIVKQNRSKRPNTWESFWLFWSYKKEIGNNKKTNYLLFKSNGLELGKSFAVTDQVFLWTLDAVRFEVDKWYHVDMSLTKNQLNLKVNDIAIIFAPDILDKTFQTKGQIAFYSEDSDVSLRNYSFELLK